MIYNSVHNCPIKIFHRVIESGDASLLIYDNSKHDKIELSETFIKIYDEYVDNFGVSTQYELFFHQQRTVLKLELKSIEGDHSDDTLLEIHRRKLDKFRENLKRTKSEDIAKNNARIRRIVEKEFRLNMETMTVFEFYTHLQDIQEEEETKRLRDGRKNAI